MTDQMTDDDRKEIIHGLVADQYDRDDVETDADSEISEGDDNGAFVRAWVWVSFADTALDKDAADEV